MEIKDYNNIDGFSSTCGSLKESFMDEVGIVRAEMVSGLSTAHYHKKTKEYCLVKGGKGILNVRQRDGKVQSVELIPGVIVKIEPEEIHQFKIENKLVVECIQFPAWSKEDEFTVEESLF